MINEILKKIDEIIAESYKSVKSKNSNLATVDYHEAIIEALETAKETILAEQKKPLTKGDVIRESNESLAEILGYVGGECKICATKDIDGVCIGDECKKGILRYLNQPQEDSNERYEQTTKSN